MALLLSEAAIISMLLEALLYGFSLFMFLMTLWILLGNRFRQKPNYLLIGAACVLEMLAFAELITNTVRVWQGSLTVGPSLPGGRETYYINLKHYTFVIKSCLYNVQTLILDAVVIYRTYLVWDSIYPVIIPSLSWSGLLVASIGGNISLAGRKTKNDDFAGPAYNWLMAVYSLTLTTNLSASVLLAFRIWKVNRAVMKYKEGHLLKPLVRVIIETGAVYLASIAVALILFLIHSVSVVIVVDMISPIICIVFNTTIIRMAFAADAVPYTIGTSRQNSPTVGLGGNSQGSRRESRDERRHVRAYGSGGHELKSMTVEFTRHIQTDVETSTLAETDRKAFGRLDDDDAGLSSPSRSSPGIGSAEYRQSPSDLRPVPRSSLVLAEVGLRKILTPKNHCFFEA